MTVIPLFCSKFLKGFHHEHGAARRRRTCSLGGRFNAWFNRMFNRLLDFYERWVRRALKRPALTLALLLGIFVASLAIYPLLGLAFFPQTDAGQFTLNVKVPTGTRIEVTNRYVAKIEDLIRHVDAPERSQDDRFEHRRGERFLVALHHQRGRIHGHHSSGAERGSRSQQPRSTWTACKNSLAAQVSRMCARSSRADPWWTRSSIPACRRRSTFR